VHRIGQHELDGPQRVLRTGTLPYAQCAASKPVECSRVERRDRLPAAADRLELLALPVTWIASQLRHDLPLLDRRRYVPVRTELEVTHVTDEHRRFLRAHRTPDDHRHGELGGPV